jgi:antitoxin HicB
MEKKNLDYYLSLKYPFKVETISEEDGGGYMITYPDLYGCMSDGETIEEALINGEDASKAWIQTAYEKSIIVPEPNTVIDKFSGRITLRTPKSLHKDLVEQAEKEGTSLNQYIVYLLSKEVTMHRG